MNGPIIRHIYKPPKLGLNVAIVMPVYNEAENLPEVLPEWMKVAKEVGGHLIVINDGSRDQSLELLLQYFKEYQELQRECLTIIDKENSGHASSCLAGYQYALSQGFQWVFQTDSDGQTNPNEFLAFWSKKEKYPFLFGHRLQRGDGWFRWLVSKILALSIFCIFRIYIKDANVPFRLMRAQELKRVLENFPAQILLANAFLTISIQKKFPIHWIPISFFPRQKGPCSVSGLKFFRVGKLVLKDFWKYRKYLQL